MKTIVTEVKKKPMLNSGSIWQKTVNKAKSIDTEDIKNSRLADLIEKGMKTKSVRQKNAMVYRIFPK